MAHFFNYMLIVFYISLTRLKFLWCSGISNEEKDHLRKNLLLNMHEENSQVCTIICIQFES